MEQKIIRLLRAEEIECRIGTISEKGISLLLYKDARADMRILDEVYGPLGWQRRHEMIGGSLYCTVSIWDEDKKQWISKMDVGTESYTEKEKGQASDSFKRASTNIGVGRELYTAPFIWISAAKVKIENKNNKLITYDKFKVTEIFYNENREIVGLTIINQDRKTVYSLTPGYTEQQMRKESEQKKEKKNILTASQIRQMNKELARTGVALDTVLERYKIASIDDMSQEIFTNAMNSLRKTKAA